jgi:hypothetical protein
LAWGSHGSLALCVHSNIAGYGINLTRKSYIEKLLVELLLDIGYLTFRIHLHDPVADPNLPSRIGDVPSSNEALGVNRRDNQGSIKVEAERTPRGLV